MGEAFARVNGADGKAFARANRTADGWLVRSSPTGEYRMMSEPEMVAVMTAAATIVAMA
jgi:hypothetical protein